MAAVIDKSKVVISKSWVDEISCKIMDKNFITGKGTLEEISSLLDNLLKPNGEIEIDENLKTYDVSEFKDAKINIEVYDGSSVGGLTKEESILMTNISRTRTADYTEYLLYGHGTLIDYDTYLTIELKCQQLYSRIMGGNI